MVALHDDVSPSFRHKYPLLCHCSSSTIKHKTITSKFQSKAKCPPETPATSPTGPTSKSKTSPERAASRRTTPALRIWMSRSRRTSHRKAARPAAVALDLVTRVPEKLVIRGE